MSVALITGIAGLIGSESARVFNDLGMQVVGIDNDMRGYFFGPEASTHPAAERLQKNLPHLRFEPLDIRNQPAIDQLLARYGNDIALIIHAAAQPSHDWAAREPLTDFNINAVGTLNILEATRKHCPDAVFVHVSTNKVYGDIPNTLPFTEQETRWEIAAHHPFHDHGIDESMSVDQCKHSLFGVSKLAADMLAQEYGRYFGIRTGIFRFGCVTGPQHAGAALHGFVAYLVKCAVLNKPYQILGYKGKQVRDVIHGADVAQAFRHFFENPKAAEVYNLGGGRPCNGSLQEIIALVELELGRELAHTYQPSPRSADHIWWISDTRKFQSHYPAWKTTHTLSSIIKNLHAALSASPAR